MTRETISFVDTDETTVLVSLDAEQAAEPIMYDCGGGWTHTPYQTADAGHDRHQAIELVRAYLGGE